MNLNLGSIVETTCRFYSDRTALIHDGQEVTYRELRARVRSFAMHLRDLGVGRGDKVGMLMPNGRSFTICYFAILYCGATVVPISYLSVAREVAYTLKDSEAVLLIASSDYEPQAGRGFDEVDGCRTMLLIDESKGPLTIRNGPPVDLDRSRGPEQTRAVDTAVILYTSGTTGAPKGAELSHFNLWSNAQFAAEKMFWRPGEKVELLGPGHVILSALPLFHSYGQTCNQNAAILGGATLTYLERFEPEAALEVMARDAVTLFSGVPTMYFALLNFEGRSRYDLGRLAYCSAGGAAMPVEVMKEFDELYGVNILEGYGLSETSPVATFNVLYRPKKIGSIGLPIIGVEVRVCDDDNQELPPGEVGEVLIRGHNVMKGYYRRPAATAEAFRGGWFHSGDLARMDEDGYFTIVDRKKDMIIRGGFNVYPREVEEILYAHAAVREAAVVGEPSERYGEEVKAFVSFKQEMEATPEEIIEFCKQQLGGHKYPRLVEVLDDLPKGPTGKILRRELRGK